MAAHSYSIYYEEQWKDGKLYVRVIPGGVWIEAGLETHTRRYEAALRAICAAAVMNGIEYIPESGAVLQRIAQEALGLPKEPGRNPPRNESFATGQR